MEILVRDNDFIESLKAFIKRTNENKFGDTNLDLDKSKTRKKCPKNQHRDKYPNAIPLYRKKSEWRTMHS
jgi:hypothetical protein